MTYMTEQVIVSGCVCREVQYVVLSNVASMSVKRKVSGGLLLILLCLVAVLNLLTRTSMLLYKPDFRCTLISFVLYVCVYHIVVLSGVG